MDAFRYQYGWFSKRVLPVENRRDIIDGLSKYLVVLVVVWKTCDIILHPVMLYKEFEIHTT